MLKIPDRPLTFPKSLYSSIFYIWMREKAKFRARTRRPATSRFPGALLYFATMMASPPEPSLSARPPRRQAGIPARFRDGGATLADSEDSPTVKEKEQKVKKRTRSDESDSDDVSAAAADCSRDDVSQSTESRHACWRAEHAVQKYPERQEPPRCSTSPSYVYRGAGQGEEIHAPLLQLEIHAPLHIPSCY